MGWNTYQDRVGYDRLGFGEGEGDGMRSAGEE